jgi:amino acid transporter
LSKIIGLAAVALAGLLVDSRQVAMSASAAEVGSPNIGLALVFVLYAYGGWSHATFVAAEVRHPRRNLPRALIVGVASITLIYVVVNLTILAALGFQSALTSHAPAADVMQRAAGAGGARMVSLLVMLSALGAINGMILTGSRVYAMMGEDHREFAWLGTWNRRRLAPVGAIVGQGGIALLMIVAVGTKPGQDFIDATLTLLAIQRIPWEKYFGGFEILVASTAPVFWAFFLLTGIGVVALRIREPERERPFRVPYYPLPVIVFCVTSAYMLYSSLTYAGWLSMIGIAGLASGVVLYAGKHLSTTAG